MSADFPSPAERAALNAALFATGAETGFWDDNGRPAPWPDDIDEWTPDGVTTSTSELEVDQREPGIT
jgi:hypothetical protein